MSYQVLARKYRPASFEELEGQEHVLRALVNALENDRLHHAYLFTGTRGVGKTTIARILARCLNCERGISARPCGECGTCLEIAEGRSVDLIEVDAASRTKVEDTRELLDNVQYMPTHNRFKVYLIDEVHMLSTHSFNALLKTLEEPPEHVKFLLATTDPKKLPVTVLSRCLQFNLKNLSPERIVNYLQQILPVEGIEFEEAALWLLGRAADGSMRDALSLTDQAISFGDNSVKEADVKLMLGSIDQKEVYELLDGVIRQDASAVVEKIAQVAEHAPDFSGLLSELLAVLHRVAMAQAVPDGIDNSQGDRELVLSVANALSPEDVQLFYQIGVVGQRDLPYAPNLRVGFEMILLRMLAFTPFAETAGDASESELPQKKTLEFEQNSRSSGASELLSTLKGAPAAGTSLNPNPSSSSTPATSSKPTSAPNPQSSASTGTKPSGPAATQPAAVRAQIVQTDPQAEEDELIDFSEASPVKPQASPTGVANLRAVISSPSPAEQAPADKSPENSEPSTEATAAKQTSPASGKPDVGSEESRVGPSADVRGGNKPVAEKPATSKISGDSQLSQASADTQPAADAQSAAQASARQSGSNTEKIPLSPETWVDVLPHLGLSGVTLSVASNCRLVTSTPNSCKLVLSESQASLWNKNQESRIKAGLTRYYGLDFSLEFEIGSISGQTPAQIEAERREAARLAAVELIEADDKVKQLIESFDGTLDVDTIIARQ